MTERRCAGDEGADPQVCRASSEPVAPPAARPATAASVLGIRAARRCARSTSPSNLVHPTTATRSFDSAGHWAILGPTGSGSAGLCHDGWARGVAVAQAGSGIGRPIGFAADRTSSMLHVRGTGPSRCYVDRILLRPAASIIRTQSARLITSTSSARPHQEAWAKAGRMRAAAR